MAFSGTFEVGEIITAHVSPANATVEYAWFISDDNRDFSPLALITGASVEITPEMQGQYLAVNIEGTGDYKGILKRGSERIGLNSQTVNQSSRVTQVSISSWAELAAIPTGNESEGIEYILTTDLNSSSSGYNDFASLSANEGVGWNPLGTGISPFKGSFNGNGYTISDLKIDSTSIDFVGIFGVVAGDGVFRNLTLESVNVTESGANEGGILIGLVTENAIISISSILITNSSLDGGGDLGAFVGDNDGTLAITNSTSSNIINSTSDDIGGFVGINNGIMTILQSINFSSVDGNDEVSGFVGESSGDLVISNSLNNGNISGEDRTAGFVGRTSSDGTLIITHSTNSGIIDGSEDEAGGFVAQINSSQNIVTISGVTNVGKIEGNDHIAGTVGYNLGSLSIESSTNNGYIDGDDQIAGIVGYNSGSLSIKSSTNNGYIDGDDIIAGIVGDNYASDLIISNTSNTAVVSSSGVVGVVGGIIGEVMESQITLSTAANYGNVSSVGFYVGGIIGEVVDSQITIFTVANLGNVTTTNSDFGVGGGVIGYIGGNSTASVINAFNSAKVSGDTRVGGIIGEVDSDASVTISNSSNYGLIVGNSNRGGIVGSARIGANATLSGVFYLTGTAVTDVGGLGSASGNATPVSIAQMAALSTFEDAGWDIARYPTASAVWSIQYDGQTTYPWLTEMGEPHASQIIETIPVFTAQDFETMNDNLFGNFELQNDIDFSSYTGLSQAFIQGRFTGNISGSGYTLTGFETEGATTENNGLFYRIAGGTIENLTISAFNITGSFASPLGIVNGADEPILWKNILVTNSFITHTSGNNYASGLVSQIGNANVSISGVQVNAIINGTVGWQGGFTSFVFGPTSIEINNSTFSGVTTGTLDNAGFIGGFYSGDISLNGSNIANLGDVSGTSNLGHIIGSLYSYQSGNASINLTGINIDSSSNIPLVGAGSVTVTPSGNTTNETDGSITK